MSVVEDLERREAWLRWYCHVGMRLHPVYEITPEGRCACDDPACQPRNWGKHPRLGRWQHQASAELDQVLAWHARWPATNWAWVLEQHFVLDSDPRNGGFGPDAFFFDWEELVGFELPRTGVQLSGGGGLHAVFQQPAIGEVKSGPLWLGGRKLRGLEVKGIGGYILVEPSNHASGGHYHWPAWVDPLEPPVELLAMKTRGGAGGAGAEGGGGPEVGDPFDWDQALTPGAVEPGEQNDVLHRAGWSLMARGVSDSLALPLLRQVVDGFVDSRPEEPWTHHHAAEMWERVKVEYRERAEPRDAVVLAWRPRVIEGGGDGGAEEGGERPGGAVGALTGEGQFDRDEPTWSNTDRANAVELVQHHAGELLWTAARGWRYWTGTHWQLDQTHVVRQHLERLAVGLRLRAPASENPEALEARARRLEMMPGVNGTLAYAEQLVSRGEEELDQRPLRLACPNGTLDLETGRLREHDPADLLTRVAGVDFEEGATSPRLDEYLETFLPDPEHQEALFRLLGACLPGGNDARLLLLLIGGTTSGKSQLASGLERALGGHCGVGQASIFRGHLDDRPRPDLLDLLPCRLALLEEAGQAWELHGDRVKHLTGGGTVTARAMRSNDFVKREPAFTPCIVANELPRIRGADPATLRRMKVVPFSHSPAVEDPRKKVEFLRDEGCLRALLAQVVAGHVRYLAVGLRDLPREFDLATMRAFDALDDVKDFIEQLVEAELLKYDEATPNSHCVGLKELHAAYVKHVQQHGDQVQRRDRLGLHAFNQRLVSRGFVKVPSNGLRWAGWRLLDPALTWTP